MSGNDRLLSMLSIAMKARALACGNFLAESAVRNGKAKLLILAEDASEGTRKKLTDACRTMKVRCISYGTKDSLGNAVGKGYLSAAAVCDGNFADGIKKIFGG